MSMIRRRSVIQILAGLSLVAACSIAAWADGVILPDHPEWGHLSVAYHDVDVTIRDGVVTTHIDQLFHNGTGRDLEGRYLFPLPPGAVVTEFTMWVDGEALEAQILDADEARAVYEDYVRRAIDPALLEYVGRDAVSARIYPIPSGADRRIEITYSEVLTSEAGVYRYRYPLDTERFSATRLDRVRLSIDIETTSRLAAVYSPSHDLTVERTGDRTATALYEARSVLPATDFFLYYAVTTEAMGMSLLSYSIPGEDGVFLLVATPPELTGADGALPKDLVFVLDRSGSMGGEKIDQAKSALRFILDNLNPLDRFALVAFSDYAESLQTQLVDASAASVAQAASWISGIDAGGGTNIDEALRLAFSLFEESERPRFLIFLTDGEPTVGEEDPIRIAANAGEANQTGARLFTFGVGYDVNTVLLDQLTLENRGTTTYVLPGENLETSVSSFYRKIASPVLADPVLTVDGIDVYDVFPHVLPDVFRGTQLVILGRYRGSGEAVVSLSGESAGVAVSYSTRGSFAPAATESTFLPRLWAGRKVSYLLDQIRLYGESDELVDEVIALSNRYGIITPYTSFLIDDVGLDAEEAAAAVYRATAPTVGSTAVQGSAALKDLAESETVQETEGVIVVDDRTYFLRDGVWTDSEYVDQQTLDVAIYSSAYFELTTLLPWIAPHLAIGDEIVLRVNGQFLRIGAEGMTKLDDGTRALLSS
jgi:Ca-activated chloride channel family protein